MTKSGPVQTAWT